MLEADNLLHQVKDDVYWRLLGDPRLAKVPVLRKVADYNLDERAENILKGHLTREGGATGACIIVHEFDISSAKASSTPNPMMGGTLTIECSENTLANQLSQGGTGLSAGALVARVVQSLGMMHFDYGGSGLRLRDREPITELDFPKPVRGWNVFFTLEEMTFATVETCAPVAISNSGAVVTLTCATSGATIRYTTDGSYPGPGNPAALVYTAAFTLTETSEVRAAASKDDLNDSKVISAKTITI